MIRPLFSLMLAFGWLYAAAQNCTGCFFATSPGPCTGSTYYTCPAYGPGSAGSYSCYQYARYRAINSNPFPTSFENLCNFSSSDISGAPDFIRVPSSTAKFAYTSGHANVRNANGTYTCKVNNDQQILDQYPLSCFGSAIMYMEYIGMISSNSGNNFSVGNVSGLNYQWTISPTCASLSGANTNSVTVTPDYTGTYTLTLKAWHPNFPNDFKTQSVNATFTVNNCQLKGKYENSTGLYCLNTFNTVSTSSTNITVYCATSGSTITWTKTSGSGSMSGTTGSTNTVFLSAGQNISINIVAKVGSTVLTNRTVTFSRGAFRPGPQDTESVLQPQDGVADRERSEETVVAVYPNPATDLLNVALSAAATRELQLALYNLMGQRVLSRVIAVGTENESIPLDLPQGIYLVRVNAGAEAIYSDKLVKQ